MEKQFAASLTSLHEMLAFVVKQAAAAGLKNEDLSKLELCVEEAFVNIIHHSNLTSSLPITVECRQTQLQGVEVAIKDYGTPFNPLEYSKTPPIDEMDTLEDPPIGGYGIYLMKKLLDNVEYKRVNDTNVLILTKRNE